MCPPAVLLPTSPPRVAQRGTVPGEGTTPLACCAPATAGCTSHTTANVMNARRRNVPKLTYAIRGSRPPRLTSALRRPDRASCGCRVQRARATSLNACPANRAAADRDARAIAPRRRGERLLRGMAARALLGDVRLALEPGPDCDAPRRVRAALYEHPRGYRRAETCRGS